MIHIRESVSPSPIAHSAEPNANRHDRVNSIVLSDRGQPACVVVLSTPSSSGGCILDVLVASNRTFRPERTKFGFDHRVSCWNGDLSVAICLLFVPGCDYVCLD